MFAALVCEGGEEGAEIAAAGATLCYREAARGESCTPHDAAGGARHLFCPVSSELQVMRVASTAPAGLWCRCSASMQSSPVSSSSVRWLRSSAACATQNLHATLLKIAANDVKCPLSGAGPLVDAGAAVTEDADAARGAAARRPRPLCLGPAAGKSPSVQERGAGHGGVCRGGASRGRIRRRWQL